jgi:hypothetical protein
MRDDLFILDRCISQKRTADMLANQNWLFGVWFEGIAGVSRGFRTGELGSSLFFGLSKMPSLTLVVLLAFRVMCQLVDAKMGW